MDNNLSNEILFRLVVNGRTVCERYDLNELNKIKDSLEESERNSSKIIPITTNGNQFLLG